jgi:hypothetical protein
MIIAAGACFCAIVIVNGTGNRQRNVCLNLCVYALARSVALRARPPLQLKHLTPTSPLPRLLCLVLAGRGIHFLKSTRIVA